MSKTQVRSLIEQKVAQPKGLVEPDEWAAFRQIEVVTLELTQTYKHSLGKYSRFYIELGNGRFFGTQCPHCQKVFTPPRPLCPDCLHITDWQQLNGTGTVKSFSIMHFTSGVNGDVQQLQTPIPLVYVLMDGSSTLFPHLLRTSTGIVHSQMRVRVAYTDRPVQHPIHLMYFVPLEV